MDQSRHQPLAARVAVVLRPGADRCEVSFGAETEFVAYGIPFSARANTLTPGHLVAVTTSLDANSLVIWRWYDAVVLEQSAEEVLLWEPNHGEGLASPRNPEDRYPAGTRACVNRGG